MRRLFALALLSMIPWAAPAEDDAPTPPAPVLTTSITLDPSSHSAGGGIYANTSIKNVSPVDQEIVIWTQAGWSWRSSDPRVAVGTEALKNAPSPFVLHPGQDYAGKVEILATETAPLTFRLGYYPHAVKPVSDAPDAPADDQLIWSNYVTLNR